MVVQDKVVKYKLSALEQNNVSINGKIVKSYGTQGMTWGYMKIKLWGQVMVVMMMITRYDIAFVV